MKKLDIALTLAIIILFVPLSIWGGLKHWAGPADILPLIMMPFAFAFVIFEGIRIQRISIAGILGALVGGSILLPSLLFYPKEGGAAVVMVLLCAGLGMGAVVIVGMIKRRRQAALLKETAKEERKYTDTTKTAPRSVLMVREIRSWGGGLIVLGIIHCFSKFLSTGWGALIIAMGVANLMVPKRGMFIVNGSILIIAGIFNMAVLSQYSGGFILFAILQIVWGVQEIRKFRRYGLPLPPGIEALSVGEVESIILNATKMPFLRMKQKWEIILTPSYLEAHNVNGGEKLNIIKQEASRNIKISSAFSNYNVILKTGTAKHKLLVEDVELETLKQWIGKVS